MPFPFLERVSLFLLLKYTHKQTESKHKEEMKQWVKSSRLDEYRTSNEGKYPTQIQDVKAAIRYLRAYAERFNIDEEKIGVMGESAGGYLTCMAALDNASGLDVGEHLEKSSRAQAACAWYPPTDLTAFPHDL